MHYTEQIKMRCAACDEVKFLYGTSLDELNKKHTCNKIKRHTNKQPGKPIYFPCSKKQSPDKTKLRAHRILSGEKETAT